MFDRSGVCAATQRGLDVLERGAERNLIKLNKGKCKPLHSEMNNLMCWYRLGTDCLEGSFAEKDLGVILGNKLNMNQQAHLCGKEGQQPRGLC